MDRAEINRRIGEGVRKKYAEGYKMPPRGEEFKEKLRAANLGKRHSEETKKKIGENSAMRSPEQRMRVSLEKKGKPILAIRGENHWNWQGGAKTENERIRKSLEYKLWREAVFERDDYTCQFCGERGGRLNADHIKGFADYPDLRFAIDNGRTLCEPYHRTTDNYGWKTSGKWRRRKS